MRPECPGLCINQKTEGVRRVIAAKVGITPSIAEAAALLGTDMLLLCERCGCVWRRRLNNYTLRFDTTVLGTYGGSNPASQFMPEPWLQSAINKAASGPR